jgi:hypothetical protein
MEQGERSEFSIGEPVFTDAVLLDLREQAEEGCLLCSLDEWEDED